LIPKKIDIEKLVVTQIKEQMTKEEYIQGIKEKE
jgi:hypothetical protein